MQTTFKVFIEIRSANVNEEDAAQYLKAVLLNLNTSIGLEAIGIELVDVEVQTIDGKTQGV